MLDIHMPLLPPNTLLLLLPLPKVYPIICLLRSQALLSQIDLPMGLYLQLLDLSCRSLLVLLKVVTAICCVASFKLIAFFADEVSRLTREKEDLMKSGGYGEGDRIIQELNRQISFAKQQQQAVS
eukprot:GILI01041382.1.p2 GENE.GILI01041382.1~~GILI01041382.1.p2  ORF type:complete len:125 (-),score=16.59 GILI01041382.1:38-412(-)